MMNMSTYERWHERIRQERERALVRGMRDARHELEVLRARVDAAIQNLSFVMDMTGIEYEEE